MQAVSTKKEALTTTSQALIFVPAVSPAAAPPFFTPPPVWDAPSAGSQSRTTNSAREEADTRGSGGDRQYLSDVMSALWARWGGRGYEGVSGSGGGGGREVQG